MFTFLGLLRIYHVLTNRETICTVRMNDSIGDITSPSNLQVNLHYIYLTLEHKP